MTHLHRRIVIRQLALACLAITSVVSLIRGDEPKVKPASKDDQRVSGVIVKAEKVANSNSGTTGGKVVLTINTAAVWTDWVRDQINESPRQSPAKDARDGAESVATKGQPRDRNTLVKVEVASDSRIETRFRRPDDKTGKESTTAGKADPDDRRQSAKPPQFRMSDLKTGLFVETEYRRKDDCNVASCVAVIRPIRAADTPEKGPK